MVTFRGTVHRRAAAATGRALIVFRAGLAVLAWRPVRHRRERVAVALRTILIAGSAIALVTFRGTVHRRAAAATGCALIIFRAGLAVVAWHPVRHALSRLALADELQA